MRHGTSVLSSPLLGSLTLANLKSKNWFGSFSRATSGTVVAGGAAYLDQWKTDPQAARGGLVFDALTLLVPGGLEAAPARVGVRTAEDAALAGGRVGADVAEDGARAAGRAGADAADARPHMPDVGLEHRSPLGHDEPVPGTGLRAAEHPVPMRADDFTLDSGPAVSEAPGPRPRPDVPGTGSGLDVGHHVDRSATPGRHPELGNAQDGPPSTHADQPDSAHRDGGQQHGVDDADSAPGLAPGEHGPNPAEGPSIHDLGGAGTKADPKRYWFHSPAEGLRATTKPSSDVLEPLKNYEEYTPGTEEHMYARWKAYEANPTSKLDWDGWRNTYVANQGNRFKGAAFEDIVVREKGFSGKEGVEQHVRPELPFVRDYDIFSENAEALEIKSNGRVDPEQVIKDGLARDAGIDVQYVFGQPPTSSSVQLLKDAGIPWEVLYTEAKPVG